MPETVTVAAEAMATRFEVALHGAAEAILRAAAEEALAEITRLEGMLSLYQPTSEIAHINTRGDSGTRTRFPGSLFVARTLRCAWRTNRGAASTSPSRH